MKSLSQHFEKEIYQHVNIMWLLLTEKHLCWSLFNSEYCKIFKSIYFEEHLRTAASENVFMKLRKIKIYSQGVFSTSTTETSSLLVFRDWFSVKFVSRYNNYLVW